jgi:hypothetical protein
LAGNLNLNGLARLLYKMKNDGVVWLALAFEARGSAKRLRG